ncbi:hypothetical protein JMJ77_0010126 [Colletotrichum scovillei]|uniref:Uncharacterized protein n=1 Tax=Colletotrichum scovillei TaxID=1209932 RepID=A0A9P7QSE6_9PEZI|nr:hypothetical protein JMJ78_0011505 [Colletotrichum scovillei]KAG7042019.1 hypothetical protein JMJ77_0010126 [Colletotrichum scovillei]KAG7062050.1 hypothetical protein JMJ76_0006333 [Colletotrichum scovillei]
MNGPTARREGRGTVEIGECIGLLECVRRIRGR